jgi:hypothetical protein
MTAGMHEAKQKPAPGASKAGALGDEDAAAEDAGSNKDEGISINGALFYSITYIQYHLHNIVYKCNNMHI